MGERFRNLLRLICCLKTFDEYVKDVYIEVSKDDMDEILIEKIKAKAVVRRLDEMNEKLERSIADILADLDEKDKELSKLENIFGVDNCHLDMETEFNEPQNIFGPNEKRTPFMGTHALLTKRRHDQGFDFRKYLIKESDRTPSDCECSKNGDTTENNTTTENIEIDENNNIVNYSNRSHIGNFVTERSGEVYCVSEIDDTNNNTSLELVIKPEYELDTEVEENSFWFYKYMCCAFELNIRTFYS